MTAPTDTRFCDKHAWCVEHDDHHGSPSEPDRAHCGTFVELAVPPHMEPHEDDPKWFLQAQLWAGDKDHITPRAYVDAIDGDSGISMDADQLGEFITRIDAFRDALAVMRDQLAQVKANHHEEPR